jgi:hypothetical protein
MAATKPDIMASLRLYTTAEGGRKGPTPPDKLGCPFEFQGELFDCRLLLDETGPLAPGAKATVPILFLRPDLIKDRLQIGSRFTLWEMGTIAEGVVKEIVA